MVCLPNLVLILFPLGFLHVFFTVGALRISPKLYFPGDFRPLGGGRCDVLSRVALAHHFEVCSHQKLQAVQDDLKSPHDGPNDAKPSLGMPSVSTLVTQNKLCQLIRGQVEECGQKLWTRCYDLDEVVHLQEAQLEAQYMALARHDPQLGRGLLLQCRTFHRIETDMRFLDSVASSSSPWEGQSCHRHKMEFLLCIQDIREALEYFLLSRRLSRAIHVRQEDAICEALKNFSQNCLPKLEACGGAKNEPLVREIALDQWAIYKELVAKRLSLPLHALQLDYSFLFNKCR